ncbi:hypothetical protein LZC95_30595 [Pendulispora brunnea]|uniref:Uncharacterized protein n=1 Tax=Pendulispora brunnea TaxID=2905690 RepID=A0ABZ2JZR9_9BACT
MTSEPGTWDRPTYILPIIRFLSHTAGPLQERFQALDEDDIAELTRLPTLFAYESQVGVPAHRSTK